MNRCLEFSLPSGASGMAAGLTRQSINNKLENLFNNKKIGHYKTQTHKYKYKVWFENEIDFTTFFLIWEPRDSWHRPIVKDEVFKELENHYTTDSRNFKKRKNE